MSPCTSGGWLVGGTRRHPSPPRAGAAAATAVSPATSPCTHTPSGVPGRVPLPPAAQPVYTGAPPQTRWAGGGRVGSRPQCPLVRGGSPRTPATSAPARRHRSGCERGGGGCPLPCRAPCHPPRPMTPVTPPGLATTDPGGGMGARGGGEAAAPAAGRGESGASGRTFSPLAQWAF